MDIAISEGMGLQRYGYHTFYNWSTVMYILRNISAVNYCNDNTLGSRGNTLWKAVEDAKTDTKSTITWYQNNQMLANTTKFHYMHTNMDTDTYFQCEDINIKSENMVKMLSINIDKT